MVITPKLFLDRFSDGARCRCRVAGIVEGVIAGLLHVNSLQMGGGKALKDAMNLDA